MTERYLTVTVQADWQQALRLATAKLHLEGYQGETLNFASPAAFFGRLTTNRWALVRALQGQGEMTVREAARRVGRDVKRVHGDLAALLELGLVERGEHGGVVCPFATVRVEMELHGEPRLAA